MTYDEATNLWVDIYLASGTGDSTASANGATISDTRNWMDFVDDFHAVGKLLLSDTEFQSIAAGSNEETNITGSADPVTTGGHVDTAGRRMISNIGCEDCCGAMYQWLRTSSMRADFDIGVDSGDNASAGYDAFFEHDFLDMFVVNCACPCLNFSIDDTVNVSATHISSFSLLRMRP